MAHQMSEIAGSLRLDPTTASLATSSVAPMPVQA